MLTVSHLNTTIEDKQILHDLNFTFEPGKIYAVMGPNGSGKSTLAYSLMGHPGYELSKDTSIEYNGTDLTELESHERAEEGLFLSFQSPLALAGVRVYQLLQIAMSGKIKPLDLRKKVQNIAQELKIPEELLGRSLNEGASGGERKKMEVLQAMALDKSFLLFDEVDTGVDVDALKTIAQYLKKHQEQRTYVLITHYNRILKYLKPDNVLVIAQGRLQTIGGPELAERIENEGYEGVIKENA